MLWAKTFWFRETIFLAKMLELKSTCPEKYFGKNGSLKLTVNFYQNFGIWVTFRTLNKKLLPGLLKLNPMCREQTFFQIFFEKPTVFFQFFGKKFWDFAQKFSYQFCQNCILRVQRNSLRKKFLSNRFYILIYFQTQRKHFRVLAKICQQGCQDCVRPTCPKNPLFINSFEKITSFFSFSGKKMGLATKIFQQGCQNNMLRVQSNTVRKIGFCEKIICFWLFWTLSKSFSNFEHIFSDKVVKTTLCLSGGTFWIQERREHVHSKVSNLGEGNQHAERMFLFS